MRAVLSVISLHANPAQTPAAAEVVRDVGRHLEQDPRVGSDGSWEFCFELPYAHAHARVAEALEVVDPSWPATVTLDYALAV